MTQSAWNKRIDELKEHAGRQTMHQVREMMSDNNVKRIVEDFFSDRDILVGTQISTDNKSSKKLMFELYKPMDPPSNSIIFSRTVVDSRDGNILYIKIYIPPIKVSSISAEEAEELESHMR